MVQTRRARQVRAPPPSGHRFNMESNVKLTAEAISILVASLSAVLVSQKSESAARIKSSLPLSGSENKWSQSDQIAIESAKADL